MREGEVARPSPGEIVTCIRSAQSGGPFVFELELAPGTGGPPTHTHDEGDETIEVLEGEMTFRVNGTKKTLRAGDSLTLTPNDPHTFWNASKTERVRARVTHGARFERLITESDRDHDVLDVRRSRRIPRDVRDDEDRHARDRLVRAFAWRVDSRTTRSRVALFERGNTRTHRRVTYSFHRQGATKDTARRHHPVARVKISTGSPCSKLSATMSFSGSSFENCIEICSAPSTIGFRLRKRRLP